jgi:uncharacterized membrane protein
MTHSAFIAQLDDAAVVEAIREAERRSSGEIRVCVSHRVVTDPLVEAEAAFQRLGMTASAQRNGVLIFIAPGSRRFAILGDVGVHRACGDGLWDEARQALTAAFQAERWTAGVVEAIRLVGDRLARWFPPGSAPDRNELPDEVAREDEPRAPSQ